MTTYSYREGSTEPISITLKEGDTAANITGYTSISIFFKSEDGAVQSETSTADSGITVTSASTGAIVLHPDKLTTALAYAKRHYHGYIIVVDASSKRSPFPSDGEFTFVMLERFSGDG